MGRIHFANEDEERVGNELFIKIYSNLAICYLQNQNFKKVCTAFNNARYRDKDLADKNVKLLYKLVAMFEHVTI